MYIGSDTEIYIYTHTCLYTAGTEIANDNFYFTATAVISIVRFMCLLIHFGYDSKSSVWFL